MSYFKKCASIEEVKKLYRELLKQYHSDIAGADGEAATVKIIRVTRLLCKEMVLYVCASRALLVNFNSEIEITGYWICCFNSFNVREQLKEQGFRFSGKHKAWIYSGKHESRFATKATTGQLRAGKGSFKVDREDSNLLFA